MVLEMTGVTKRLGGRPILAGVDLSCAAGELALVLGENGAGKSTLLRIAAGIVEPDAGAVTIGGEPLAGGGVSARARLGYAPDTADAFPELSVRELIALVVALRGAAAPAEALRERLGVAEIWHQRLRTLSFGQVKRSYLLAALVGAPPLLILDEPSNGLDPAGMKEVRDLVRELGRAIHAFFGADPAGSQDYGRIVDTRHFDRLVASMQGADIAIGGGHYRERRYIAPTVVLDPADDSPLMQEEIFGPILPVLRVPDVETAIERIERGAPPLAAYVFTRRADVQRLVETRVRAGAIGVNVCAAHLAVPGLPFGGVGESGMGRYHGRHGFDSFSQARPVFSKGTWLDTLRVAYPPYSALKEKLLRRLL